MLKRNNFFYDNNNVWYDEVKYYPTEDNEAALRRFRAGELDINSGFPENKTTWLKKNMPKIDRNGVEINYEVYGSGPALFLTHGFSATSKMWDDQIDALSKYFTLIVWDMRGHGQSDYPDDEKLYNEEETIEDIRAILFDLKIDKVLTDVGIELNAKNKYPHEFSGGQRQRIAIARSLIMNPNFMILDEPTSALDRSIQIQVINLLKDIQNEYELSYLFISHDLKVIRSMSDYIFVMKDGIIVESGLSNDVFDYPKEKYTKNFINHP